MHQAKVLCQLLRGKGRTVWYDYEMASRDTAAMQDGVRRSSNFLLFLSGDPEILHGTDARPTGVPRGCVVAAVEAVLRCLCCVRARGRGLYFF